MVFLALKISGTILVHIILFALFPAFQIQGGCLAVKIRAAVCFSLLLAPFFHVLVNSVKPIKWCVDCYRYPARGTF